MASDTRTPPPVDYSGAPDWFLEALALRPERRHAMAAGDASIHYECWNPADGHKPPLLLVHGYRAHTRVWDGIAPFLCDRYRVHALDFAGMGESGHRSEYSLDTFDADLLAVVAAMGPEPVTLIGHSFGGGRVLRFCADHGDRVHHAVIIDTFIHFLELPGPHSWPARGQRPPYPDRASIIARYRLLPDQPAEPWMLNHMAHHSVRQVADGWAWKFDPRLPGGRTELDGGGLLASIRVPLDVVAGALSDVNSAERLQRTVDSAPLGRGPVMIPQAHHHIMFDQPLALVGALRALLATTPNAVTVGGPATAKDDHG